jgi:integrase
VQDVTPKDVRLWLSRWDQGLKTKANYHGLLFAVFAWAVEEHAFITVNPCAKTAPSRPTIKAEQPERTWLTEAEFKTFTDTFMAESSRDLLRVMVGTGLRFGEITALWVEDIDLTKRTLSVREAWNRQGEDGQTQIPKWLTKRISPKHEMRGHYLGIPKTPKSRRTITIAPSVVTILRRVMKGKSPDDFVFTTAARSTSSASVRWTGGRRQTQCYKRGRLPTRPTTFVPESGYNRCRGRRDTHTTGRHRGTAMGSGHHCPGRGCRRRTQTTLSDGIHWRD